MKNPDLIYTTFIRTTPEKLWDAITNPEFTSQYWGGLKNISDWKEGSKWQHVDDDGTVMLIGEIVESVRLELLVMTWVDPDNIADTSRVTFEIKQIEDMVCLNVIHGDFKSGSDMVGKVSSGWPRVLSSMKSFLETGRGLDIWAEFEKCSVAKTKGVTA